LIKTLFVFGTRPEAIKLAPVIQRLKNEAKIFDVRVCVTAQHREMLDQVLGVFGIRPDYDLNVMRAGQTLSQSASRILAELEPVLKDAAPHMVLVQGDTTTTLCGAMAAFYAGVPTAHVEAGLRTGDMRQPFPEEMNRVLVSRLAALHFAATTRAAENLRTDGVWAGAVLVTGNTGIDAVLQVRARLETGALSGREWPEIDTHRKLIVVTAHRRESFGAGFERICAALARIAERDDVQLIYPVHPNPNVAGPVRKRIGGCPRVHLVEPLDYVSFVDLMRRAYLLLTDSGGIQEEGPSLGKPVLVLREKTERPEAVEAGTVELVGNQVERIVTTTMLLLDDKSEYARRCRIHNPYGDGRASERIAAAIRDFCSTGVGRAGTSRALPLRRTPRPRQSNANQPALPAEDCKCNAGDTLK
jgi:UDP-N-acetylglucosamine 2-epimerase (non-hydrolysing)